MSASPSPPPFCGMPELFGAAFGAAFGATGLAGVVRGAGAGAGVVVAAGTRWTGLGVAFALAWCLGFGFGAAAMCVVVAVVVWGVFACVVEPDDPQPAATRAATSAPPTIHERARRSCLVMSTIDSDERADLPALP